jgi:hypothetical protein
MVKVEGFNAKLFDVEVRGPRKDWMHSFHNLDALIFTVPINEYDMLSSDDLKTNSLSDSLNQFEELHRMSLLENVPFVLLLTKKDQFEKKFSAETFSTYFLNFTGTTAEEGAEYINGMFKERVGDGRILHSFAVDTTDSKQVAELFKCFKKIWQNHHPFSE